MGTKDPNIIADRKREAQVLAGELPRVDVGSDIDYGKFDVEQWLKELEEAKASGLIGPKRKVEFFKTENGFHIFIVDGEIIERP